jgi:hypothetical protein
LSDELGENRLQAPVRAMITTRRINIDNLIGYSLPLIEILINLKFRLNR